MNNGNFYEIFAKISLQNVFPDEFSNLTLSDRPDLIDDTRKLGIEVTYATNEKEEKCLSYSGPYPDRCHCTYDPDRHVLDTLSAACNERKRKTPGAFPAASYGNGQLRT